MKTLRSALDVLRDARRPYLILNVLYYGLVVCAMVYTAFDRSLQQAQHLSLFRSQSLPALL